MRSHKLTKAPRSIIAIKTTIVESVSSLNLLKPFSPFPFGIQGQLAFLSSDLTSLMYAYGFIEVCLVDLARVGRVGGIRTPDTRFWRPVL